MDFALKKTCTLVQNGLSLQKPQQQILKITINDS